MNQHQLREELSLYEGPPVLMQVVRDNTLMSDLELAMGYAYEGYPSADADLYRALRRAACSTLN